MNRPRSIGVASTVVGMVLFGALYVQGALRHPDAAREQTHLGEFVALGVAFFLVTTGIVIVFATLVEEVTERGES